MLATQIATDCLIRLRTPVPHRAHHENFSIASLHRSSRPVTRRFRLVQLRAERPVNNLELLRSGSTSELEKAPLELQLEPYGIGWLEVGQ